jgi:hypothetical protein
MVRDMLESAAENTRGDSYMTTKQAIRVVRQIILDNRENGELEGILNRHRIAALNRLVHNCDRSKRQAGKITR